MGVPQQFLDYLKRCYTGCTTTLRANGRSSRKIRARRGVRQGDPLSPLLFNYIMDWALSTLDPNIGVSVGESLVNHLAFADDVSLLATTSGGLQLLASQLEEALNTMGLKPNAAKSASLRIVVDGKKKLWVCDPRPFLSIGGQIVPVIDIEGHYKYLGTELSATRRRKVYPAEIRLNTHLKHLEKAPLKPQQRLFILRVHVIPGLFHALVLDETNAQLLHRMDLSIRHSLRKWLHFPHDISRAFMYADAKDGGLGIQSLKVQIPLLRRARIERFIQAAAVGADKVTAEIVAYSDYFKKEVQRWGKDVTVEGVRVSSPESVRGAWSAALHKTVDGLGLIRHNLVPQIHNWVISGTSMQSGHAFIGALQVRAATLHTAMRASRGFPNASTRCDACGRPESLGHILQNCQRTAVSRDERHNRVHDLLSKQLSKQLLSEVISEPSITTSAGLRRPDMIFFQPGIGATVIDVSIISDYFDLDAGHMKKAQYYSREPEIAQWVATRFNIDPSQVGFGACVLNWRGAFSPQSAKLLKDLGLKTSDLTLLSIRTVEYGYKVWKQFKDSTWQTSGLRQRLLHIPTGNVNH